ncbi:hypothetical protein EB74_24700 [Mycobacterium sp. SWH-M5]|nr:hypothetical protein EB74_24700 [Mycobacterium sp. SWH-M5]
MTAFEQTVHQLDVARLREEVAAARGGVLGALQLDQARERIVVDDIDGETDRPMGPFGFRQAAPGLLHLVPAAARRSAEVAVQPARDVHPG